MIENIIRDILLAKENKLVKMLRIIATLTKSISIGSLKSIQEKPFSNISIERR